MIPLETILSVNALLLGLALVAVFVISSASLKYRHEIGNTAGQHRWRRFILLIMLPLFFISLAAAAFNLLTI